LPLNGLFAPAETPESHITLLNQEIARIMTRPEIREHLPNAGMDAMHATPGQFAATIESEMGK
jgi:tripartite-type tricarboxylate transporter receptor subunit TctC